MSFNSFSYLLALASTDMGKEGVLPLMTACIKKDGLTLCTIPFYYRDGIFKTHSSSLFSFVDDASLTSFQDYVKFTLKNNEANNLL